jgi:hypothetical protein
MIISARIQQASDEKLEGLEAKRMRLEAIAMAGERMLSQLRSELTQTSEQRTEASQIKARLSEHLSASEREFEHEQGRVLDAKLDFEAQKKKLAELEKARPAMEETPEAEGSQSRSIITDGNRQYLTGLRMGGRHILILVDASASMLASTVVNVVRLRHMPTEQKLLAAKWKQTIGTVDWLTANLPAESRFQIYTFNTTATRVLEEKGPGWIDVGDGSDLDEAVARLRKTVPSEGTSLHAAFSVIGRMSPRPDNVYLLVDGLPTQGESLSSRPTVSGKQRLKLFSSAIRKLPRGVPMNVILFEMEGDPYAPDAFWKLARHSQGSFMSPSLDWP